MPRPLFRTPQVKNETKATLTTNARTEQTQQLSQAEKMRLDRLLRRQRSKAYMEAMHKLDAGGHVHNADIINDIINTIKTEFPEVELSGILLGYVAVCNLGRPYEVHTLDMTGMIIEHYKSRPGPPGRHGKSPFTAMRGVRFY